MIEQETQFTLSQFKKKFGITNYQWKNRKEDLLEHLKTFFDMDVLITDNNNYTFIVYEQLFEYEPLPRKVNEAKREHYRQLTHQAIEKSPYNTGANIARNIKYNKQEMDNDKVDTISRYNCKVLKEDFYRNSDEAIWCYCDDDKLNYIPLDKEQLEFLYSLFGGQQRERKQAFEAHVYSQERQKIITKREAKNKLHNYNNQYYGNIFKCFK